MEILTRAKARVYTSVRLVGGETPEILSIDEVFGRADQEGLDVILVSDQSNPPVLRIADFKKLEYEKNKAKKANKTVAGQLKEVQFKVNISDHDMETKVKAIKRFVEQMDKVKISVRLKGREREQPQRAWELLDRVVGCVPEARASKVDGPIAIAILEPKSQKSK